MRAHMAAVVVGWVSDMCVAGCVTHEGPWFEILKVNVETLREAFVRRMCLCMCVCVCPPLQTLPPIEPRLPLDVGNESTALAQRDHTGGVRSKSVHGTQYT